MSIILSKNLKQKQSVKLTPSLKKSIDLLQLSRFELIKKIDKEIIENPFLEKNDANNDYKDFNHSDFSFDIESKLNLRESLITQLDDFHLNEKEIKIAKLIIGCIDESGELSESIDQIEEISNFIYSEKEIEDILLKNGFKQKAKKVLERSLMNNPDNDELLQLLDENGDEAAQL